MAEVCHHTDENVLRYNYLGHFYGIEIAGCKAEIWFRKSQKCERCEITEVLNSVFDTDLH